MLPSDLSFVRGLLRFPKDKKALRKRRVLFTCSLDKTSKMTILKTPHLPSQGPLPIRRLPGAEGNPSDLWGEH